MENYLATPFSGEWDEDPKKFLGWFLQCTAAADDARKAHDFIYYLRAGSNADEWFEDLPEEEKRSWVRIERLFRRKWLKEEISIKKSVTSENEPEPPSTHLTPPSTTSSTPTKSQTSFITPTAMSQLPEFSGNTKNSKIDSTSEILLNNTVFPSKTPNIAASSLVAPSTTFTARETRSTTVGFTQKQPKVEKSSIFTTNLPETAVFSLPTLSATVYNLPATFSTTKAFETQQETDDFSQKPENIEISIIFTKNTPQISSPSIVEHPNDAAQAHTSLRTADDAVSWPHTFTTTASSSESPQLPAGIVHQKSALLCDIFELRMGTEFLAPTIVITGLKTRPASARFTNNHQKVENSLIFTQNHPESLISCHSNSADITESLPTQYIPPTKHPCTFSGFFTNSCFRHWHSSFVNFLFYFSFTIFQSQLPFQIHFYYHFGGLLFFGATRTSPCSGGAHGVVA
jgi:hypothetical protein